MSKPKNEALRIAEAAEVLGMSKKQVRSNVPESFRTVAGHRMFWLYDLLNWKAENSGGQGATNAAKKSKTPCRKRQGVIDFLKDAPDWD